YSIVSTSDLLVKVRNIKKPLPAIFTGSGSGFKLIIVIVIHHFPSLALTRSGSKNSEVSPRSQLDTQALPVLSEYLFVLKRYHKFQICQTNSKTNERELHKYYSFLGTACFFIAILDQIIGYLYSSVLPHFANSRVRISSKA